MFKLQTMQLRRLVLMTAVVALGSVLVVAFFNGVIKEIRRSQEH